ncbi:MAG: outer membrane protein assembly factor [Inquilinus sp.]|nr:outer membrane protein assembly factor [Inquilinus sp.]
MKHFRSLFCAIAALIVVVQSAGAAAQAVDYTVAVGGAEGELLRAIEGSATLVTLRESPPPTLSALIRRAEDDVDRVTRALRAFGHYLGSVEVTLNGRPLRDPVLPRETETGEGAPPVRVDIAVEPGPVFTIAGIELLDSRDESAVLPVEIDIAALPVAIGGPARSADILAAEGVLVDRMRAGGHPFAAVPERRAVVDFATETMTIDYLLRPGDQAVFGAVRFEGLERIEPAFLARLNPIAPGDVYDPAALDALRKAMNRLGVFDSVRVRTAEAVTPEGRLPVTVTLAERKRRFIGFGADFATSEGFGARAYWGHRNLFGAAERFRVGLEVSRIGENSDNEYDYALGTSLRKPAFLAVEQDLVASADLKDENLETYERTGFDAAIGIDRRLSDTVTLGYGVSGEYAEVTDSEQVTDRFTFIGLPLSLRRDTTDSVLDPARGTRATLGFTPFLEALGSSQDLYRTRLTGSAYWDFGTGGDTVLAGLVGLGALAGESRDNVPADKRFYVGGGGTVRGYDFQGIGPLDDDGDPVGGRSMVHFSLELRQQMFGAVSLVPFVDGGQVFEASYPDFEDDLQYGAGLGLRYETGFGPLRLDVAVPINGRDTDPSYAFYISLGQAF